MTSNRHFYEGLKSHLLKVRFQLFLLAACLLVQRSIHANDYIVVVDTSASMAQRVSKTDPRRRIAVVQVVLRNYLRALPDGSRLRLISFNAGIKSDREYYIRTEADRSGPLQWIDLLNRDLLFGSITDLWRTLEHALGIASEYAKQHPEQPVTVCVLTDGEDNSPGRYTLDKVLAGFPNIDSTGIRASLILLGDLEVPVRTTNSFLTVTHDSKWELLFPPIIKWSPKSPRVAEEIIFFEGSELPYSSYRWRIDSTLSGNQKTGRCSFTSSGEHTISLEVTGVQGAKLSATGKVMVLTAGQNPFTADFVVSPGTPQPGETVKFFGRCSGSPSSIAWLIDGHIVGTNVDVETAFPKAKEYEVQLVARDSEGNEAQRTQKVSVKQPALISFKAPAKAVSGQAVQFVNESRGAITSVLWDFGDGSTSTEIHPTHVYNANTNVDMVISVQLTITTESGRTYTSLPSHIRISANPNMSVVSSIPGLLDASWRVVVTAVAVFATLTLMMAAYVWRRRKNGSSGTIHRSAKQHPETHAVLTPHRLTSAKSCELSTTEGVRTNSIRNERFDVFLSHNSQDKPMVRQLGEALKARGLRVWLDEWELVPGRSWQEALEDIIQSTKSAAVIVGVDGLGPWEIPEMRGCLSEFVNRKLSVIPVLLPGAPTQPTLPLFLRQFTWVDFRGGLTKQGLDRLEWGITGRKP